MSSTLSVHWKAVSDRPGPAVAGNAALFHWFGFPDFIGLTRSGNASPSRGRGVPTAVSSEIRIIIIRVSPTTAFDRVRVDRMLACISLVTPFILIFVSDVAFALFYKIVLIVVAVLLLVVAVILIVVATVWI